MLTDRDDFIVALLQVDEGAKYDYEQTQRATQGHLSGELRLLMAVLLDALDTVRGKPRAGLYIRRERCAARGAKLDPDSTIPAPI